MEQQIDGIRAWIAMEKARTAIIPELKPIEVMMMFAIRAGHNTSSGVAAYLGYIGNKKVSKKRTGTLLQEFKRIGLIDQSARTRPVRGCPMFIYMLTHQGKKYLASIDGLFDDIYPYEFKPNVKEHLKLYTQ